MKTITFFNEENSHICINFTFLQPLANVMKIDVSSSNKLWKDRVNLELGIAVTHSFKKAGCVIIDQHSLVSNVYIKTIQICIARGSVNAIVLR